MCFYLSIPKVLSFFSVLFCFLALSTFFFCVCGHSLMAGCLFLMAICVFQMMLLYVFLVDVHHELQILRVAKKKMRVFYWTVIKNRTYMSQ